jgi:Protein of unknown function (DUF4058)
MISDQLGGLLHGRLSLYDRGRYHLAIDYNTILQPLLSEADQAWLKTFA